MKSIIAFVLFFAPLSSASAQSVFSTHENGEARSRVYDVLHYKIDVSLDEQKKTVAGTVTTTLRPFMNDMTSIEFDAEKMNISKVTLEQGKELRFDVDEKKLTIHLDRSYSSNETLGVSIQYNCSPKSGMTFNGPDSGYPGKRWQIWSQGEDMTNHFWFPCYDFPNDKATSEVIATVRKNLTVLSNGKLVSVKEDKKNGTKTYHWMENKPHVAYLIMVAAGEYAVLQDRVGKLPVEYYVYPDDTLNARICFRQTPDMIKFFNDKIGFAYPWEKYGQIILQDHFGGMENSSATTLSDVSTVYDARVRVDNSPTGLIAHELAHQWWGDVVTCKDWRHIWLNESFASYFDPLYHEHWLGRDEFDYSMYNSQQAGIDVDTSRGRRPIVSVESYGENIYPRGAAVLHMLRFVLGDQLFWKAINHYITKHQFTCVETNDLKLSIEEATGQNLYWFFDEWVYKAGHPIFDVSYTWSDSAKAIFLSVRQTQTIDSLTEVFRMPVDIEVTSSAGSFTHRVSINNKDSIFSIPSSTKPQLVIFDKGNWLLKELKFTKSAEEWAYQAGKSSNPIDRFRALQQLASLPNNTDFIEVMSDRMLHDSFWAVRREAAFQLGKIETKNESSRNTIKEALLAAYSDIKASVRDAAISQLGKFKSPDVVTLLHQALKDSSYNVLSSALRSLAKADSANALTLLKTYLDYPSFRNRIANAALNALSTIDTVQVIPLAIERARYGQPVTTRFAAMGILTKYGKGRDDVQALCLSLVSDKNNGIKSNAVRALGNFGGEAIIPVLESVANDKENSASEAAKGSIEKIKKRMAEKK